MRRFSFVVLFVFALLAAACGNDAADTETGAATDEGGGTRPSVAGDWILQTLTTNGVEVPRPDDEIDMTISAGEIGGNLGCNSFFGSIDVADDGSVVIGAIGQTEMACADQGRMGFEAAYGQALGSVTAWAVDPTGLTLSGAEVEIRYTQAPPAVNRPLVGTVWNFDTIFEGVGVDRAASSRADMDGVALVIGNSEATLLGPGCAGTVISVEFDAGSEGEFRTGSGGDLTTNAECGVVGEALAGLTDASGFMINENRLTFIGEAGETVGFSAEPG